MDALKIYHTDGTLLKDENGTVITTKSLTYTGSWMGECFVSVTFKNPAPINFSIGDYLTYRGEVFEINYDPGKIKSSSRNSTGEAFTYDSVKFNSKQYELVRAEFLDIVLHDNETHYTSLTKFPFYVQSVDDLLDRIQANLDEQYGTAVWNLYSRNKMRSTQRGCLSEEWVKVYGEGIADNVIKSTSITVDGKTCWDALALVNSQFDINFIVRGRNVYVGTAGVPTSIIFEYGKGNGLYEIEQNADSEQSITTRLRAYGSTKNMPSRYYANMDGSTLPNNMAVNNLMLPGFPNQSLQEWWNAQTTETKNRIYSGSKAHIFSDNNYRPFIDSTNINEIGVRPNSIYFDTENLEEGIIEIYPTIEEMEVGGVRIDEVESADIIEDNGVFKDGETVPNFHIYLKSAIDFDINDLINKSTETPYVSMKDGMCGAREFQINSAKKLSDGRWELTCQRQTDDSLNLYFPYNDYQIKGGDHFVLTGIPLPDSYVTAASIKLLKYALEFLDKNDYTRYVYSPKIDEIFMARQHDAAMADTTGTIQSIHDTIKEGDFMQFTDNDIGIEGSVTIDQLTIKEEDGKIPTYEVTLREDKSVGTIQKIQNKISSLESGNGGLLSAGGATSQQIQKLIESYGGKRFLSKLSPDTAQGLITFLEGIRSRGDVIIGEQGFANGLTGYGMKLGRDGAAEMRSLILNESLEVPELRYNRVDVYVGNQWRAPGAGIIESVEPDGNTGVVTLKLEEGEIGTVDVDDICMGIYHDGVDTANNAIDNYDDSMGNFRYAGFVTCYFRITEILDEGERKSFRYSLRQYADGTFSKHPSRFMHFVGYGNFSKAARQTSKYSTLTYDRYLRDVSTWEFGASNIAAQFGDLSNLNVFGMNMSGYSAYLNNIYFSGTVKQLADLAIRMEIENTFTEMLDYGESTVLKFRLMRGWENVTGLAARWTVARDSGDATNDQAWHTKKKVTAFEGMPDIKTDDADKWVEFEIAFRDGDNDLSMEQLSTLFTFTAYDEDNSVLSNRIISV